jgi:hypothetical protein
MLTIYKLQSVLLLIGGLGVRMLDTWYQKTGTDPRTCKKDETAGLCLVDLAKSTTICSDSTKLPTNPSSLIPRVR